MPAIELPEAYVEEERKPKEFRYAWVQQVEIRMPTPGGEGSIHLEVVPMAEDYSLPDPVPQATPYGFTLSELQGMPEFRQAWGAMIIAINAAIDKRLSEKPSDA